MKVKVKSKEARTVRLVLNEKEAQILGAALMSLDWESQEEEVGDLLSEIYDATAHIAPADLGDQEIAINKFWYGDQ